MGLSAEHKYFAHLNVISHLFCSDSNRWLTDRAPFLKCVHFMIFEWQLRNADAKNSPSRILAVTVFRIVTAGPFTLNVHIFSAIFIKYWEKKHKSLAALKTIHSIIGCAHSVQSVFSLGCMMCACVCYLCVHNRQTVNKYDCTEDKTID